MSTLTAVAIVAAFMLGGVVGIFVMVMCIAAGSREDYE